MQVGDIIRDTTTAVTVATLEGQHVTRDRLHLLAESAESLLERMERLRTGGSVDKAAVGLERSAMCQWVVDLTYRVVRCAYVGIAQICDATQAPEPLAAAGRSALEPREWWSQVRHALFAESSKQVADAWLTGEPLMVRLPSQQTTAARHVHHGRTVCAVPISVGGELTAIFAVEPQGSSSVPPTEVVALTRAMASTITTTLEALARRQARSARETGALRTALDEMEGALGLVSHELKAPLTTIMGSLQLIESKVARLALLAPDTPDAPEMRATLASIQDLLTLATRYTEIENRIVTDLIEASRVRSAKMTLRRRPCDLALLVHEAVDAQHVASQRGIIHLGLPERSVPVSVDPDRVVQVVTNLLGNALKYAPKDTAVEVRVEVLKTHARVSVRDYGPGLEKHEIKRVWQRFYRAGGVPAYSATGSATGSGLGLGLYIGREIVRGHGGKVGVTSVAGHGATFWFTLPLIATA